MVGSIHLRTEGVYGLVHLQFALGLLCCELDVDCECTLEHVCALEPVCAFIFNLYLLVSTQVIRLAVKCEGNQNNETMVIQNKIVASLIPPLVLINCRGFFFTCTVQSFSTCIWCAFVLC